MKPGNFILDLLRTYRDRGTSARNIMAAASMFDFSENLVRVTLSRLVARGLVENYQRGRYRLADLSDPVSDFVEEWKLGESRRRRWEGQFVLVHYSLHDARSDWVLNATGFRQFQQSLWVRPDNLNRTGAQLDQFLRQLGLSNQSLMIPEAQLLADDAGLVQDLYNTDKLNAAYQHMNTRIKQSASRLHQLPTDIGMRESFSLGGEAIQVLAKDPLLPDEYQQPTHRQALWQSMIEYDELGRRIWAGQPGTMPAAVTNYS